MYRDSSHAKSNHIFKLRLDLFPLLERHACLNIRGFFNLEYDEATLHSTLPIKGNEQWCSLHLIKASTTKVASKGIEVGTISL